MKLRIGFIKDYILPILFFFAVISVRIRFVENQAYPPSGDNSAGSTGR